MVLKSIRGFNLTVVHPFSCIISQKANPGNVIVTRCRDIFSLLTQIEAFSERILVNFAERDTLIQLHAITLQ